MLPSHDFDIEAEFPGLTKDNYVITSPQDETYNCIAWAAEEKGVWWPDPYGIAFWPPGIRRTLSIESFQSVFSNRGYEVCSDSEYQLGYQKIAIFTRADGSPTHAARQLDHANWTSKLGRNFDIRHELNALNGVSYGRPTVFMRKLL